MNRVTFVNRTVDCIVVFVVYLQGKHDDTVTTVDCSQRIVVRSALCQETAAEIIFVAFADRYHYRFLGKDGRQNRHFDARGNRFVVAADNRIAVKTRGVNLLPMPNIRQIAEANGYGIVI